MIACAANLAMSIMLACISSSWLLPDESVMVAKTPMFKTMITETTNKLMSRSCLRAWGEATKRTEHKLKQRM